MEITMHADALCTDGLFGKVSCVIIDPKKRTISDIVIKENHSPHTKRVIPVWHVKTTLPTSIEFDFDREKLQSFDLFVEPRYVEIPRVMPNYILDESVGTPMTFVENIPVVVKEEHVPAGEVGIHRGAQVQSTNGVVGRVDEFLFDGDDEHITHLVMREGHLWGQKDISIPISAIDRMQGDTVYLNLDKKGVENLPVVPIPQ